MAEEANLEVAESNPHNQDMDLEAADNEGGAAVTGESNAKRPREEEEDGGDATSKKQKVEKSVEEERLERKLEGEEGSEKLGPVSLGPKTFGSSVDIFDYFYKLLHYWPPNLDVNKYEGMVLLDLLKKGHPEPDKKIGGGVRAFQVRYHPTWKSRCFFLIREDDSDDDFSFRKCVDHILPLPEDMKIKPDTNKALGGGGRGRGGKGGRGRGRGGKRH